MALTFFLVIKAMQSRGEPLSSKFRPLRYLGRLWTSCWTSSQNLYCPIKSIKLGEKYGSTAYPKRLLYQLTYVHHITPKQLNYSYINQEHYIYCTDIVYLRRIKLFIPIHRLLGIQNPRQRNMRKWKATYKATSVHRYSNIQLKRTKKRKTYWLTRFNW